MFDRDIVFFDLETTGLDFEKDRIVQFAARRMKTDMSIEDLEKIDYFINPMIPIPEESTAIHGITNEMVEGCPAFRSTAHQIIEFMEGADLGGFNVLNFDIPMLMAELRRNGRELDMTGRRIIDVCEIFHRMYPRNLEGAVRNYLGIEHEYEHNALGDVDATIQVFEAQRVKHFGDIPESIEELSKWCLGDRVTIDGKIIWAKNGVDAAIGFGKHKGELLQYMACYERRYLFWMLDNDFSKDVKDIVFDAIEGRFQKRGEK